MRTFIGLEIPDEIKTPVSTYLSPMMKSPKGWEHPHDYHLTLLFIGDVPEETLPEIVSRMKNIPHERFLVRPAGFRFFSRRIMFLAFHESPELERLARNIRDVFPEFVRKETKEFLPHVTVKRWQRYEYDDLSRSLEREFELPSFFVGEKLSLFKSEKDPENRKYHVIART